MEGPHGSSKTPEETVAWLWGVLFGLSVACVVVAGGAIIFLLWQRGML